MLWVYVGRPIDTDSLYLRKFPRGPVVAKSSPRAEVTKRVKKDTQWEGVVGKDEAAVLDRSDKTDGREAVTEQVINVDVSRG